VFATEIISEVSKTNTWRLSLIEVLPSELKETVVFVFSPDLDVGSGHGDLFPGG